MMVRWVGKWLSLLGLRWLRLLVGQCNWWCQEESVEGREDFAVDLKEMISKTTCTFKDKLDLHDQSTADNALATEDSPAAKANAP